VRLAYYRRAALNAGVPEFWAEDAAQDMALDAWRDGRDDALSVRRRAVDAARRYGTTSRRGIRKVAVPLAVARCAASDPFVGLIMRLDLIQALARLSAANRASLERACAGLRMSNAQSARATRARRRLRALLVA